MDVENTLSVQEARQKLFSQEINRREVVRPIEEAVGQVVLQAQAAREDAPRFDRAETDFV